MAGPTPRRLPEVQRLDAADARGAMRRALLAGGSCALEVQGRRRALMHDPRVDRPTRALPWPLSLFQAHTVRYVVLDDERRVSSHIYSRAQMGEAIEYFLRDVAPDAQVTITHAFDERG